MTLITFQDGKPVMRDGKVGTGQGCCCGEQCDCSSPKETPVLSPPEHGYVTLVFESCYGEGLEATASVAEESTVCNYAGGAITSVTVTNPGSGYAKLGNAAPTITASVGGGNGAVLSVTLGQGESDAPEGCGSPIRVWWIESVEVLSGGTGYTNGDPVTFSVAGGDTVLSDAEATASVTDGEVVSVEINWQGSYYGPEDANAPPRAADVSVNIGATNGFGAVLDVVINQDTASPDFGKVSSVSVTDGGTGYFSTESKCDVPENLYITWGTRSTEVPVSLDFDQYGNPAYLNLPVHFLFSLLYIEGPCVSEGAFPVGSEADCRYSPEEAEESYGDYIWQTFSTAIGAVLAPETGGGYHGPAIACQCGGYVYITLLLQANCWQYVPMRFFYWWGTCYRIVAMSRRIQVRQYCLRFDKDENGCPIGDATVVSEKIISDTEDCSPVTDWYGNTVDNCACNTDCFGSITPHVSFMPP